MADYTTVTTSRLRTMISLREHTIEMAQAFKRADLVERLEAQRQEMLAELTRRIDPPRTWHVDTDGDELNVDG